MSVIVCRAQTMMQRAVVAWPIAAFDLEENGTQRVLTDLHSGYQSVVPVPLAGGGGIDAVQGCHNLSFIYILTALIKRELLASQCLKPSWNDWRL
jgi:hypothetical protein